MFTPQAGTEVKMTDDGESVKITFYPKNKTVYAGFYLKALTTDKNTWLEENYYAATQTDAGKYGAYELTLGKEYCGKMIAIAPVKPDGASTTTTQYYLAIPSADKLPQKWAEDADVYVTISNAGRLALAHETVTVKDLNGDEKLSYDEAMEATHEAYCKGGYEAAPIGDYYSVSKLWGVANGGSYMFYRNDIMTSAVNAEFVDAGDELAAAVMKDVEKYTDRYTYFTEKTKTVAAGEAFTLTMLGDNWWTPVIPEGVEVGIWEDGSFTPISGAVTDAEGKVTLILEEVGNYIISAEGTIKGTAYGSEDEIDCPVTAPVCIVTVKYGDGWQKIDGKWYYYKDQEPQTGWQQVNGKWYYLGESGVMQTGWQQINGKWYYLAPGGAMLTGWQQINGKWYYLAPGGAMLTGWQKINGTWYYLAESGAMVTGWQKINGTWYYFAASGAMQTGWQKINGTWYYLAASGAMVTGWLQINGTWYYFTESGAMVTGTQMINGKVYKFSDGGAWIPS